MNISVEFRPLKYGMSFLILLLHHYGIIHILNKSSAAILSNNKSHFLFNLYVMSVVKIAYDFQTLFSVFQFL